MRCSCQVLLRFCGDRFAFFPVLPRGEITPARRGEAGGEQESGRVGHAMQAQEPSTASSAHLRLEAQDVVQGEQEAQSCRRDKSVIWCRCVSIQICGPKHQIDSEKDGYRLRSDY